MRIVNLQAENFKILRAIEITPSGDIVEIGGKNGQGKSSVLDAVWVALAGKGVAPPMPIRKGEEKCTIRLDLGEYIVTRKFSLSPDGKLTDSVKLESADGKQRFNKPQLTLDELMGQIGFDPFAFVQLSAEKQAAVLLEMVPLPIDLEALARQDAADYSDRRDFNRDVAALDPQIAAIAPADVGELPDRDALVAQLGEAANINSAINAEKMNRVRLEQEIADEAARESDLRDQSEKARQLAIELAGKADEAASFKNSLVKDFEALPPLNPYVDTDALRQQISAADAAQRIAADQARRADLIERRNRLAALADEKTAALAAREKARRDALGKAKMPIEGLEFAVNDKDKPVVLFRGVPFEQSSSADQIRASAAIAMASNPELRVLRIKDGSLLDEDSMAILQSMAKAEDYQIWLEVVGDGGSGIIIENGQIRPPKEAVADKPEGALI